MENKVPFLTGHLLNIHQAFPTHTHFKPLSENRGTHTVATHNRVSVIHQSHDYSLLCFFSVFGRLWRKKNSAI